MIGTWTSVLRRIPARTIIYRGRCVITGIHTHRFATPNALQMQGFHRLIQQPRMVGNVLEQRLHKPKSPIVGMQHGNRSLCISNGDVSPEKLEELRQRLDEQREMGYPVPENFREEQLAYLATLSGNKRPRYLQKLYTKEQDKKHKMEAKNSEIEAGKEEEEEVYGPAENRILRRIAKPHFQLYDNWNLSMGIRYGSRIAFDFTYESLMTWREIKHLVIQLSHLYSMNKKAHDPFHFHWANFSGGGIVEREMKAVYNEKYDQLMIDVTSKGLLDVFPREDIVYLTPDSNNLFKAYDPDKVYVIGALVDTSGGETGASLAQAKMLGVEHCRLPLSECLQWTQSHKSLTLDVVTKILMDMKTHSDIRLALDNHVPKRKHTGLHPNVTRHVHRSKHPQQDATFSHSRAEHSRNWDVEGPREDKSSQGSWQRSKSRAGVDRQTDRAEHSRKWDVEGPREVKSSHGSWQRSNSRAGVDRQTDAHNASRKSQHPQSKGNKAEQHKAWFKSVTGQ